MRPPAGRGAVAQTAIAACLAIGLWLSTVPPARAAASRPAVPAPKRFTLEVRGSAAPRAYLAIVPEGGGGKAPGALVVLLHDAGRDAAEALAEYGWAAKAAAERFVLVAPEALPADPSLPATFLRNPRLWNDGAPMPGPAADDVAYLGAVLDDAARRWPAAAARTFMVGAGEGGSMALSAAAALPGRLAAVASWGGHLLGNGRPKAPLPVFLGFGARDPLSPSAGGTVPSPWRSGLRVPSIHATAEAWRTALGCPAEPAATFDAAVGRYAWKDCAGGARLELVTVADQGHAWPGATRRRLPARIAGPVGRSWNGVERIWAFFTETGKASAEPR